jgi:two-component system sensor histidine kinase CssS
MIKRIRIWLADLDLTQQLYTIIFLILIGISFFYFFYLDSTLARFTDARMNDYLISTHSTVVNLSEQIDMEIIIDSYNDEKVVNYIYDSSTKKFLINGELSDKLEAIDIDLNNIKIDDLTKGEDNQYIYSYLAKKIDSNKYLITIVNNEFRDNFNRELNGNMININFIVIFAFMFVLMSWIGSVIKPLNRMQIYVNKIKNGEKATLKIVRRDEIGVLADSLVNMQKELAKQDRIKEEMIQNISHDLKTPIATIKSYSESIKDGIYPYDTLEKSVDVIYEHADRLENKVYSLLMLNKMGYLEDNLPPGNNLQMKDVISKVLLSLKVINPSIELIAQVKDDVYFHGEEEPWRIVVENLVDNAIRYAKSKIIISTDYDTLTVFNDGGQLDDDRIAKLFKPYEKGTDGNFGLGLSIVKRICDTYDYKLSGENMNDGVIFRIQK